VRHVAEQVRPVLVCDGPHAGVVDEARVRGGACRQGAGTGEASKSIGREWWEASKRIRREWQQREWS